MMSSGNRALYTIMVYTVLYALGEAQYSGKKKRVTVIYTFLSRVDLTTLLNC